MRLSLMFICSNRLNATILMSTLNIIGKYKNEKFCLIFARITVFAPYIWTSKFLPYLSQKMNILFTLSFRADTPEQIL